MTRAIWIVKKNIARHKIMSLSTKWGGDDAEWLKDYIRQITSKPFDELEKVLVALDDLNHSNYYRDVLRET